MHQEMTDKILLAQSEELLAGEQAELEEHLAGCEDCRRFRRDLETISAQAAQALPAGEPSPFVLPAIRSEAERRLRAAPTLRFVLPALRVLACAAALLLLLAGWQTVTAGRHTQRIHDVDAILTVASLTEAAPHPEADIEAATGREEKLRVLARQLLQMEGLGNGNELSLLEI